MSFILAWNVPPIACGGSSSCVLSIWSYWALVLRTTVKVVGTVTHQWKDVIIISSVRAQHRLVFREICLISLHSVSIQTLKDEGIHHVSVVRTFVLSSTAHSPHDWSWLKPGSSARLFQSTCRFKSNVFLVFFRWMRPITCILLAVTAHQAITLLFEVWCGLDHPSWWQQAIISPMSLSQYYMFLQLVYCWRSPPTRRLLYFLKLMRSPTSIRWQ